VSKGRYVVRPKADSDLDDQAYYYATVAGAEMGHRFLVSAATLSVSLRRSPIWDGTPAFGALRCDNSGYFA